MFSNKIDLPYCLVVFFVVCPRLRPFWSVFGELACFWCSTAKIKTRQHRDFRSNQECPSLEANNSAGKLPPGLNSSTHSKQRCCSSMSIHSIHNTSHRSFTSDTLSPVWSASQFRIGFVQTAVDPFADRIVCRVTKISPARVASVLQSTNKPVSSPGPLERFCQDRIVYIDQSKSTGNVFANSKIKIALIVEWIQNRPRGIRRIERDLRLCIYRVNWIKCKNWF